MRKTLLGLALIALSAAVVASVSFAGKEKDKKYAADEQAQMQAYMEVGAPNEHHEAFKKRVGQWNAEVKMWQAPNTDPMVSTGKSKYELSMGGRFLTQYYEGDMMGMKFVGMGVAGYDKTIDKHTTFWIDSMGTQAMYTEGECSDHCNVESYRTTINDPMSGKEMKVKMVTKLIDENKHVFEWYNPGPDGKEFKSMEIVYTRI
ncbi:MAG: DUF1579 domain-containing protein [Candidatus Krumholzibacteria bacterium]|nr:DUF1579 domain-containing protein [Candidatus Krumholzibacteria bacterium]